MNVPTRIARLLVVVALILGAPLPSIRTDQAAAFRPSPCLDQLFDCARLQHSEDRAAIVSAREATQFSLKSSKRSSPWQAAVLLAAVFRSTTQNSISYSADGRITLAAAGLTATPVRAPPATA